MSAQQPQQPDALLLVAGGLFADCAAGAAILAGHPLLGIALHLPAVALWVEGIARLTGGSLWHARRSRRSEQPAGAPAPSGWPIGAAVLGLALFPGLGTIGYSLALACSLRLVRGQAQRPAGAASILDLNDIEEAAEASASASEEQPMLALEVQPLIDALLDAD